MEDTECALKGQTRVTNLRMAAEKMLEEHGAAKKQLAWNVEKVQELKEAKDLLELKLLTLSHEKEILMTSQSEVTKLWRNMENKIQEANFASSQLAASLEELRLQVEQGEKEKKMLESKVKEEQSIYQELRTSLAELRTQKHRTEANLQGWKRREHQMAIEADVQKREILRLSTTVDGLAMEKDSISQQLASSSTLVAKLQDEAKVAEESISTLYEEISTLKNQAASMEIQAQKLESLHQEDQEMAAELKRKLHHSESELVRLQEHIHDLESKQNELVSEAERLSVELQQSRCEAQGRIDGLEGEAQTLRLALKDKEVQEKDMELLLDDERARAQKLFNSLEEVKLSMQREIDTCQKDLEDVSTKAFDLEKEKGLLQDQIDAHQKELEELLGYKEASTSQIDMLRKLLADKETDWEKAMHSHSALRGELEECSRACKELLQEKNGWLNGESQLQLANEELTKEITVLQQQIEEAKCQWQRRVSEVEQSFAELKREQASTLDQITKEKDKVEGKHREAEDARFKLAQENEQLLVERNILKEELILKEEEICQKDKHADLLLQNARMKHQQELDAAQSHMKLQIQSILASLNEEKNKVKDQRKSFEDSMRQLKSFMHEKICKLDTFLAGEQAAVTNLLKEKNLRDLELSSLHEALAKKEAELQSSKEELIKRMKKDAEEKQELLVQKEVLQDDIARLQTEIGRISGDKDVKLREMLDIEHDHRQNALNKIKEEAKVQIEQAIQDKERDFDALARAKEKEFKVRLSDLNTSHEVKVASLTASMELEREKHKVELQKFNEEMSTKLHREREDYSKLTAELETVTQEAEQMGAALANERGMFVEELMHLREQISKMRSLQASKQFLGEGNKPGQMCTQVACVLHSEGQLPTVKDATDQNIIKEEISQVDKETSDQSQKGSQPVLVPPAPCLVHSSPLQGRPHQEGDLVDNGVGITMENDYVIKAAEDWLSSLLKDQGENTLGNTALEQVGKDVHDKFGTAADTTSAEHQLVVASYASHHLEVRTPNVSIRSKTRKDGHFTTDAKEEVVKVAKERVTPKKKKPKTIKVPKAPCRNTGERQTLANQLVAPEEEPTVQQGLSRDQATCPVSEFLCSGLSDSDDPYAV